MAKHQLLAIALDHLQQIVEIMRDFAGDKSDRLQLLVLRVVLLHAFAVGDVDRIEEGAAHPVAAAPALYGARIDAIGARGGAGADRGVNDLRRAAR